MPERPFSLATLNEIFKLSPKHADCVNSRESSWLEFKESFNWGGAAEYTRTCAAFANVKGGYIVFGIKNKPHRLIGLKKKAFGAFEGIDPAKVSEFLNQHFAPEIRWEIHVHEVAGKQFGLLYVHEATEKPVVCTCEASGDKLREGDIYYRYRGRTMRIKYPELRAIMDARRLEEQKLWLKHLAKIARVGVRDAAVFDLASGQVTGAHGTFVIDESLLSQLSFIKEGEFSETRGKPSLKLIGSLEAVPGSPNVLAAKQVVKSKGIRTADIVLGFLDHQKVSDPDEYLKQVCFESTAFMPVYYYMHRAKLDRDAAIQLVDGVLCRGQAKGKLLGRLRMGTTQQMPLPTTDTTSARKRRAFVEQAKKESINERLTGVDLKYCLQALRALTRAEVRRHSKYLRALLKHWFNKHYASQDGVLADNLRRTTCWLDEALFMPATTGKEE
jgi:hypothetical protein